MKLCVMGRAVCVQLCNWVCVTRVREVSLECLYLWNWGLGGKLAGEGAARSRIGFEVTPPEEGGEMERIKGGPHPPIRVLEGIRAVVGRLQLTPFLICRANTDPLL